MVPSLFYTFHFYLFGVIAVAAAIVFVTRKSPVAAAMWLVVVMFSLSAMFILLDAQFIGAIQVIVYAGAIMVVFLFVIMLLNLGHPAEIADARGLWPKLIAGFLGLVLMAQLFALVRARLPESLIEPPARAIAETRELGAVAVVARPLFTDYLLAFEVTSVLLLAAMVGAVVIGRRRSA